MPLHLWWVVDLVSCSQTAIFSFTFGREKIVFFPSKCKRKNSGLATRDYCWLELVHMINSIYCASLYSLCYTVYNLLHPRGPQLCSLLVGMSCLFMTTWMINGVIFLLYCRNVWIHFYHLRQLVLGNQKDLVHGSMMIFYSKSSWKIKQKEFLRDLHWRRMKMCTRNLRINWKQLFGMQR